MVKRKRLHKTWITRSKEKLRDLLSDQMGLLTIKLLVLGFVLVVKVVLLTST
jgi:hypothetical protein